MPKFLHERTIRNCALFVVLAVLAMTTLLSGCGSDSASEPPPPPVPVSTVSIMWTVESITVGESVALRAEVKSADGTALTDRAVAWSSDDVALATVSGTGVLTAVAPGVVAIRATSEGRTGRIDARIVAAPAPAPVISTLLPSQITAGWPLGFTLSIGGANFTPDTRIRWDGAVRETQFVGATTLRVQITPADVQTARDISVVAETPAPGGGSATAVFPVRVIPVDVVDLQSPWGSSWTWVNNALPLTAVARSAAGVELGDRRAVWSSDLPDVARTVPTGDLSVAVYGMRRGAALIDAVVDGIRAQRNISVYDAPTFDVVFSSGVGPEQYIGIWSPMIGEAPRRLNIPLTAFTPSPAPDGTHIVFTGIPRNGSIFDSNVDLYIVKRDGTGLRRLTLNEAPDYQPAWSPDGTHIAFASTRGGERNVWVINSDGSNMNRLTDARPGAPNAGSGASAGDPAWSPDGSRLVYGVTVGNKTSLWIMDADGNNKRPLTEALPGSAYDPEWSANGQLIGFRYETSNPSQVSLAFVSALDGSTAFPVLNTGPMATSPAFSPDGQWLMASNRPTGSATLYVVPLNASGGPRVVLPASLGGARSAHWMRRPDAGAPPAAVREQR